MMKKLILSLVCLFATTAAEATIQVGANAQFQGKVFNPDGSLMMPFTGTMDLIAIDSQTNQATWNSNFLFPGAPPSIQEEKGPAFPDETQIQSLMADCSKNNGTPETITVPAGTFPTCKIPVADENGAGFLWLGAVPFLSVRTDVVQKATGQRWLTEISSFHW